VMMWSLMGLRVVIGLVLVGWGGRDFFIIFVTDT